MAQNGWKSCIRALLAISMAASIQPAWSAANEVLKTDKSLNERAHETLEKGLSWLKSHQKENGSWSDENYPALTALGLWAAARSGRADMTGACEKAAAFVSGFAQQDGGIYKPATGGRGSGGLSTYNTAISMTALHSYNRSKYTPIILKAREYMAGSQLEGDSPGAGGFSYDRVLRGPRARADLSNTGWALMAMRVTQDVEDLRGKTGKAVDVDWAAAMKFVGKLQNTDESDSENYGGFGYEEGGERGGATVSKKGTVTLRGYGSMTYAGLESMLYAQVDRSDPRVRSAIDWATRHWSVDENPGMGAKGLFYYYNIMAKALNLAGGDTLQGGKKQPIPWRQELINKLIEAQRPDGSWSNTDNTFWENDPALVTAYAVLTLEYAMGK